MWAAGVCLWVFVFGTLPFIEDMPDELFEAILQREPAFPDTKVRPSVRLLGVAWLGLADGCTPRRQPPHATTIDPMPFSQAISSELQELLLHFLQKAPEDRITLGDALDHPWSQLADEDMSPGAGGSFGLEGGSGGVEEPPSPLRGTLRSRAYSFQQVHVTQDEIRGAIRTVNNFVLVVSLLQEWQAERKRRRRHCHLTPGGWLQRSVD